MPESAGSRSPGASISPTGSVLLGMLTSGDEMSGYDIKKWFNWSTRFFYPSPAFSQIYSELKRLEQQKLVRSRVEGGTRSRRLYTITDAGRDAVVAWANDEPVEPPTLKHPPMMRMIFGHLLNPGRLRDVLTAHVDNMEQIRRSAETEARWAGEQPAWAYARLALSWSERYYANERELALQMLKELDDVEKTFAGRTDAEKFPVREYWYEVERRVAAEEDQG